MKHYYFKDRLYIHLGTVAKMEYYNNGKPIADDNGFVGKVGKLIGRNYCRLIPKIRIYIWVYERGFDFGWLIRNFSIIWYKKSGANTPKTSS